MLKKTVFLPIKRAVWKSGKPGDSPDRDMERETALNNTYRLQMGYKRKRIINSPIVVLRARERDHSRYTAEVWETMTTASVTLVDTSGGHLSIFYSPHVENLAENIKKVS